MEYPLTALLLSQDAQTLSTIDKTFEEFNLEADVCLSAKSGQTLMEQRKFDLLVLDFDMPGAMELTDGKDDKRKLASATIALTGEPSLLKHALSKRVHFVVQKPFTSDLMARTLKAAYGLVVREKRAAFRHSVSIRAKASLDVNGQQRPLEGATVQDLSETGLLVKINTFVSKDAIIHVDFELPETTTQVHTTGKVVWSDTGTSGQVGVQFQFVPPQESKSLQQWLRVRCPWDVALEPKMVSVRQAQAVAIRPMQ